MAGKAEPQFQNLPTPTPLRDGLSKRPRPRPSAAARVAPRTELVNPHKLQESSLHLQAGKQMATAAS